MWLFLCVFTVHVHAILHMRILLANKLRYTKKKEIFRDLREVYVEKRTHCTCTVINIG